MNSKTKKIVGIGLFTAIVLVLQFLGGSIRFGMFSISLVLVPIVVGAAIYGWQAGAWLGFIFGVAVLVSGDAALFLGFNVAGTIITVLLKGTLAGLAAAFLYKIFDKKNRYLAVSLAAITTPIVNTGIFFLGSMIFFFEDIQNYWSLEAGEVTVFVVTGLIGFNFIVELILNLVLVPSVYRLVQIAKKK